MAGKSFGKSVKVEKPLLIIIRGVKSKGLVPNQFGGEDIPGYQIRFNVPKGRIDEIQEAWSALNPKNPSPFFGDDEKWMTGKCEEVSDSVLTTCRLKKQSRHLWVDIKFGISSVFVNENGERFPQVEVLGLKKVKAPKVVTEDF